MFADQRKSELNTIKRLDMAALVESAGIQVKNGHFKAVWRDDRKPSVSILQAGDGVWIWKDHGTNEKGTNIDLFMLLYNFSYVQAVKALREKTFFPLVTETRVGYTATGKKKKGWKILDEYDLNAKTLQLFKFHRGLEPEYLKNAGIKQLLLLMGKKKFSLCGHQNMSGNWELYNVQGSFKSSTGKDITYISRGKDTLIIAESLIDAISCEQIKGEFFDLLVLNTVEMTDRAVTLLNDLRDYSKIVIATDNDNAGKKAADMLIPVCKAKEVINFNYGKYKDPNEYLKIEQKKAAAKAKAEARAEAAAKAKTALQTAADKAKAEAARWRKEA